MIPVQTLLALGSPYLDLDVTLLIQTSLFVLLLIVVNFALVKPYLRAREGRDSLTTGAREESKAMQAECAALEQTYSERRQLAQSEVEAQRRKLIAQANEEAQKIMDEARQRMQNEMRTHNEKTDAEIALARSKAAALVQGLGAQISEKLCSEGPSR